MLIVLITSRLLSVVYTFINKTCMVFHTFCASSQKVRQFPEMKRSLVCITNKASFYFGELYLETGVPQLHSPFSFLQRPGGMPSLAVKRRVKLLSDIYPARCAMSAMVRSGVVVRSFLAWSRRREFIQSRNDMR